MGPVGKNFCHATTFSVIWKLMSYNNEGGLEKTSGDSGGSRTLGYGGGERVGAQSSWPWDKVGVSQK